MGSGSGFVIGGVGVGSGSAASEHDANNKQAMINSFFIGWVVSIDTSILNQPNFKLGYQLFPIRVSFVKCAVLVIFLENYIYKSRHRSAKVDRRQLLTELDQVGLKKMVLPRI